MSRRLLWFFMSAGSVVCAAFGVSTWGNAVAATYFSGLTLLAHWVLRDAA